MYRILLYAIFILFYFLISLHKACTILMFIHWLMNMLYVTFTENFKYANWRKFASFYKKKKENKVHFPYNTRHGLKYVISIYLGFCSLSQWRLLWKAGWLKTVIDIIHTIQYNMYKITKHRYGKHCEKCFKTNKKHWTTFFLCFQNEIRNKNTESERDKTKTNKHFMKTVVFHNTKTNYKIYLYRNWKKSSYL